MRNAPGGGQGLRARLARQPAPKRPNSKVASPPNQPDRPHKPDWPIPAGRACVPRNCMQRAACCLPDTCLPGTFLPVRHWRLAAGGWPGGVLLGWLRLSFCLAPSSLAPCGAWVRILQSCPARVADGKCSSGASRRMPPVPAVGELAAAPTGETARARQTAGCAAGRRAFFLHGNARCARPRCASRR